MSSPQFQIAKLLRPLMPDLRVNFKHPNLIYSTSGKHMELDFWSEEHQLGIEYQGEHHYFELWERGANPSRRQHIDREKKLSCNRLGISYIAIPYWWDRSLDQLVAKIREVKPEFASSFEPTRTLLDSPPVSAGLANGLNLGLDWKYSLGARQLWSSEKLDGTRAYWNGKNLYTRHGLLIGIPKEFRDHMPSDFHLDGELWISRGSFFQCNNIIKSLEGIWAGVQFRIFDSPKLQEHSYPS